MPVDELNIAFRLVAVGAGLSLLVSILGGKARWSLKLPLGGLLVGTIAYLLHADGTYALPRNVAVATDLLSVLTPFWTWLFARRLFERDPRREVPVAIVALLAVLWATAWFGGRLHLFGFYGIHIASLGLLLDLLRVALSGRDDDLVEQRRLLRLWLPVLIAALAATILGYDLAVGPRNKGPIVELGMGLLILALNLFAALVLLRPDRALLLETGSSKPPPAPDALNPQEAVLLEKLNAAMTMRDYRVPGLTIGQLAERLGVPEHRLRALINRRLGYRNFSAFLNHHRIAEAREILADRERVDLPVLTIAMDLGYNSLPTFNRAFRELAGCTPTEFRQKAIGRE